MYLSYSGFKTWEQCQYFYFHRYVKNTQLPKPMNRVNMLYGSIVGVIFERFYNEKMWRIPNFLDVMLANVPGVANMVMAREVEEGKNGVIDWDAKKPSPNYKSLEDLLKDVREAIPRGIRSIKHHRLVGKEAAAEVRLDSRGTDHTRAGRADFVIRRVEPHGDLVILDGKGSKFRDEYADRRQLRWYAMLYEEHHNDVLPDQVGFLYWRSEAESAIDWYTYTKDDTAELRSLVVQTMETIEGRQRHLPLVPEPTREQIAELFPTRPGQECRWCDYRSVCEDGTRFMANRGKAPLPISGEGPDAAGVDDIGL